MIEQFNKIMEEAKEKADTAFECYVKEDITWNTYEHLMDMFMEEARNKILDLIK
jgi:hypothetical protein